MTRPLPFTPERERLNLFHHGTIPWRLTPNAVLETAKSDLRARVHDKAVRHARRQHGKGALARKLVAKRGDYAFLGKHVRDAGSPTDLLRRAIEDRPSGMASERVETLALYTDIETVLEALRLAERLEQEAMVT